MSAEVVDDGTPGEFLGWLIWSSKHGKWWAPDGSGYTELRKEAGRYSFARALKIVTDANRHLSADRPNETICPEWERE